MTAVCSIINRKIFANLTIHRNITFKRMTLDFYQFIRAQKAATRLLGAQFSRSHHYVEIDITYRCNLKCKHCYINKEQHGENTLSLETIEAWLNVFASKTKNANVQPIIRLVTLCKRSSINWIAWNRLPGAGNY